MMTLAVRYRRPPGFWVPDEVLELLPEVGLLALGVYCTLGLYRTLAEYPAPRDIAAWLSLAEEHVWDAVETLYDKGLLNDADVRQLQAANLQGFVEQSPPQQENSQQ
jgi:hypothetical protein